MKSQSATTGVNARGSYADLTQYDVKLQPSPLVPRKKLKKEANMNEAFMRGFLDELEKKGGLGSLVTKGVSAIKGAGGVKGIAGKAVGHVGESLKDPFVQMQVGQGVLGGIQNWRQNRAQARQQNLAAQQGLAGSGAKKRTGLMGGLGLQGAQ